MGADKTTTFDMTYGSSDDDTLLETINKIGQALMNKNPHATDTTPIKSVFIDWVNMILDEIYGMADWSFLKSTQTFVTDGSTEYTLNSDAGEILALWRADQVVDEEDVSIYDGENTGDDKSTAASAVKYAITGHDTENDAIKISLLDTPDTNETYTYRFLKKRTKLANDSDTPLIPVGFRYLIVIRGIIHGADMGNATVDIDTGKLWDAFTAGIKRMKKKYTSKKLGLSMRVSK